MFSFRFLLAIFALTAVSAFVQQTKITSIARQSVVYEQQLYMTKNSDAKSNKKKERQAMVNILLSCQLQWALIL